MLLIRSVQMHLLHVSFEQRLLTELVDWVLRRMPSAEVDSSLEFQQRVADALRRSKACGMVAPSEHRGYLTLAVCLGWDFHSRPEYQWVEECLGNTEMGTPSDRMLDVLRIVRRDLR